MCKTTRICKVLGLLVLSAVGIPTLIWISLTHEPAFYRAASAMPKEERRAEAKKFMAQSLQLRNDIVNEPHWEAAFSDHEVNAWLAEDLVTHFAERIPDGVHEPRIVFENDRVTMAFQLDQGPVRSVVWVVARARVPNENQLALTIEKIRAGVVPIPAEQLLDRITESARSQGLVVTWERDGDLPMALIKYTPSTKRRDIVLERLQILNGQIRLAGRSSKARGAVATPTLPTRKVLQSTFPERKKDQSSPRTRDSVSSPFS